MHWENTIGFSSYQMKSLQAQHFAPLDAQLLRYGRSCVLHRRKAGLLYAMTALNVTARNLTGCISLNVY